MRYLSSFVIVLLIGALFFGVEANVSRHRHHRSPQPSLDSSLLFSRDVPSESALNDLFVSYINSFEKKYSTSEFHSRFKIFKANIERIRRHNIGREERGASYTMGINQFTDLSKTEFKAKYSSGFKSIKNEFHRAKNYHQMNEDVEVPDSIDYRWPQYNAVTPVKNQGICGACWTFSTTGSIEGAYVLQRKNPLTSFSEQQLLDCDQSGSNQGCNGGLMDDAFQYIIANGGLCTEAAYPYINTTHLSCLADSCKKVVTLSGYKDIPAYNETALLDAVATVGPVSVAIEADQPIFQSYTGGIIKDPSCGTGLDHAVLVVGYGTENGQDYWIVKNSWGPQWGERGYVRLARNVNQCGISQQASYPTL